jgi:hypothetical protein
MVSVKLPEMLKPAMAEMGNGKIPTARYPE